MIELGRFAPAALLQEETRLRCPDGSLAIEMHRPWFRAYLRDELGLSLTAAAATRTGTAHIPQFAWERHSLLCSATGFGKTRASIHCLLQFIEAGHSVVLLDPKCETADLLVGHLVSTGFPAEAVTIIDPRLPNVPGWNPLIAELPLPQIVSDCLTVIQRVSATWGPRLADTLGCTLTIMAAHGLSFYETIRFLTNEAYRAALLQVPIDGSLTGAASEARLFFTEEMAAWGRSDQASSVSPIINKIRGFVSNDYLRALLCAKRNSLRLGECWERQRIICVALDRGTLGETGAALLAGLLVGLLGRTAMHAAGEKHVILAIDEAPLIETYLGTSLTELLTTSRSLRLHCWLCCQHLTQLSDRLTTTILANAGVLAFGRLGSVADAKAVAESLALGTGSTLARLTVDVERADRDTGEIPRETWRHPIRDGWGRPLRLSAAAWQKFTQDPRRKRDPIGALLAVVAGMTRLYVDAADDGVPTELRAYVHLVPVSTYSIEGPTLALVVTFPRPRVTGIERRSEADATRGWARCLQDLPIQHMVLRVAGEPPALVRVADAAPAMVDPRERERFLARSASANAQPAVEIAASRAWREHEVQRVASGASKSPDEQRTGRRSGKEQRSTPLTGQPMWQEGNDGCI